MNIHYFFKILLLTIFFVLIKSGFLFSQTKDDSKDALLYLLTAVKAITSTNGNNNSTESTTGVGKLGVSFKSGYFYGSVLFNVTSRNEELSTTDSSETRLFANNLLIPDNSGQGLSNFNISLGMKSFTPFSDDWEDVNLVSWKRIGTFLFWQVNNTVWTKDSLSTSVYISSLGLFATYNILSLELLGEDRDKVYLSWFGGFENRIIGGDYSLDKNIYLRDQFLGTEKLKFQSFPTVGFKLENFMGKLLRHTLEMMIFQLSVVGKQQLVLV